MFDGFRLDRIDLWDVTLRVRHGGNGPAVLLLHGHPRTHCTWHRVAPLLAAGFTVVCPDLRGYGGSAKPSSSPDHRPYSKHEMALDCLALMKSLGHDRFSVVGHDRGAYVAFRLAMEHPDVVDRLAVLDAVPIGDALARADARFAERWWHWFFLGQTDRPAEPVINADPLAWYRLDAARMGEDNYDDVRAAVKDPATVHAMCEDYRAGLTLDRAADDADRAAGRRLDCPTLVLWSTKDDMFELYGDPHAIWHPWAADLRTGAIDSGHHMAEESPVELASALHGFLSGEQHRAPAGTPGEG